jgi:hypothetical protein
MMEKLDLIKYRDAGMSTHTYFWVNSKKSQVSPFFDNEHDAISWSLNVYRTRQRENPGCEGKDSPKDSGI